jgi:hypothetical protein
MKNLLIILAVAMVLPSCGKQLDLYPHSAASADNISEKDVEVLLNGVINKVQNAPGRESYIMFDLIGGNMITARGSGGPLVLINNILRPEYSMISDAWNGYYNALYQVNILLKAAIALPESARKNELLGIAHFFRGYIYYNMVTRWGGVPVLEENSQEKLSRNSETEVWAFVESELQEAIDKAPGYTNYFYPSKEAAQAMMARTLLAEGKKTAAAQYAEQVITSGLFQLDSFNKIFRGQTNNEEIFAFANLTAESSINISTLFYTYAHPVKGSYVYAPTDEVMNLFDEDDNRKAISIDTYQGNNVFNKYPSGQSGTDPVIVTRLAEMYLISAEGQGMAGLARLNQLRVKRGLTPISPSSETEYLDAVMLERRRELLAEGFRWYDLVRTGRAVSTLDISDYQQKMPLPENELILNDLLEQNEGY